MKKILNKIGAVLQVVLAAPLKLPGKASNILRYIALGLGILETVLEQESKPPDKSPADLETKATTEEREKSPDPRPRELDFSDQGKVVDDSSSEERSEGDETE